MTIPGPLGVSMAFGASMPCGAGTTVGVGVVVDRRFHVDVRNRILVAKFRESGHVTLAPSLQMEYGAA